MMMVMVLMMVIVMMVSAKTSCWVWPWQRRLGKKKERGRRPLPYSLSTTQIPTKPILLLFSCPCSFILQGTSKNIPLLVLFNSDHHISGAGQMLFKLVGQNIIVLEQKRWPKLKCDYFVASFEMDLGPGLLLVKNAKKNIFMWHAWHKARGMTIFWAVFHFHHHHHHHHSWWKSLVVFSNSCSRGLEIWLHKASQVGCSGKQISEYWRKIQCPNLQILFQ